MSFFPDPSTIVNIGGVSLKWSLLTTVLGCILGFLMISRNFRKNGYKQTTTDDLLILSGAGCIIGGRAVWVVENWHSYSLYAWGILEFSDGGFDYAGILLGILVAILPVKIFCSWLIDRLLTFRLLLTTGAIPTTATL